jgi:hypothetical protein
LLKEKPRLRLASGPGDLQGNHFSNGIGVVSVFQTWQPVYAEHGIATFPVEFVPQTDGKLTKKPMVSRYGRFGLRASCKIAEKFDTAEGIGASPGMRNGFTVADVDEPGNSALEDCIKMFGDSPVIAESTATGKHHVYYSFNGEARVTRPIAGVNLDILGHQTGTGNFVVLPPSRRPGGEYRFIRGSIEDFHNLPAMQNVPANALITSPPLAPARQVEPDQPIFEGKRNYNLWVAAMRKLKGTPAMSLNELLDYLRNCNAGNCCPQLEDEEVAKIASSAWGYQQTGRNWFGRPVVRMTKDEIAPLMPDTEVGMLYIWAKASFKPDSEFWLADGLAAKFGWTLHQFRETRRRAVQSGLFRRIRGATTGNPALYVFGDQPGRSGKSDVGNPEAILN